MEQNFYLAFMNETNAQTGCFRFVAYYRVSTGKQGNSGLGIDAQRACVQSCIPDGGQLIEEVTEVASGRSDNRPELLRALELCKERNACLIIAKLDRLARDVEYLYRIMKSGVKVQACDLPEFNTLTLGIFAAFAQYEAERISDRTKKALDAKKARGDKEWRVGGFTAEERAKSLSVRKENRRNNPDYQKALGFILLLRKDGLTWRDIAARCNESGFTTRTGAKILEGSAHRMVKYHWADYVHDKWNASKESTLNPYTKVQDLPKAFREACEDKYAQAYGLDATNRFKPAPVHHTIQVPKARLVKLTK